MDFTNEGNWKEFWVSFGSEIEAINSKKGFSYEVPKEEQIRSSLYAHLRKLGEYVEVESDFLDVQTNKLREIDLRVLADDTITLVEIKRTLALKGWVPKHYDYADLKGWKEDIEKLSMSKLENEKKVPNCRISRCFFLTVFFDSEEQYGKIKIRDISEYIQSRWKSKVIELDTIKFGEKFCRGFVWIEQ